MKPKRNAVLDVSYRRAINNLLDDRGLTPYALARILGWSESLMYYRLARLPRMRIELLDAMAKALQIPLIELIKIIQEEENGTEKL